MADEVVVPAEQPVVPAVAPVEKPAPVVPEGTPEKSAVSGEKASDTVASFVKKATLLGEDPDAKPVEGEVKKDGDNVAEGAKTAVVPEKYEAKVPEGMTIDTAMVEAITPVLKKHGITQEAFQELVNVYAPKVQEAVKNSHEAAMKQFDEQIETWGKESKEMLGPDLMKAKAPAVKLINTFGGKEAPALRQLLTDTGLGNHPLMLKFLINVGKAISSDAFVDGGAGGAGGDTPEAAQQRMYPSMKK